MKKINFRLYSKLCMNDTIKRIAGLLSYEHVSFDAGPNSIKSTHVPFPIVSLDKRMFSRKNWVGINPFIYISSIEMFFTESTTKETQIDISVDQYRTIVLYSFSLITMLYVAIALPNLWLGISFFFSMAFLTRLFIFNLCVKKLIRGEILNAIRE